MSIMEHLLKSLDEITLVNNSNADAFPGVVHSDSLSHRNLLKASSYLKEAEDSVKKLDPKLELYRQRLPIFQKKTELLRAMERNQVLIIIGETGCGKTTQIPQYLKEIGLASKGRIACTQLRRMAAKGVAARTAREQAVKLGDEVGYTIRFEDQTSGKTQIQYMTDGILLRSCVLDRLLTSYSAVILDESHERSIDTDILLGTLRWIITKRTDLKLIISSATIDGDKFSKYFFNATVFKVDGRMFPVQIFWEPSVYDIVCQARNIVIKINETQPPGDILVFMTGERSINELEDMLYDYKSSLHPTLCVLPCYSSLPWEDQALIFESAKPGQRKVVIATNIAETSITVNGILYVIDSGFVKQKVYNPKKDVEELKEIRISQAQAIQRSGRAGRVAPGKCYRLYSKHQFDMFLSGPDPEIVRSNLINPVLVLKQMGFDDLNDFVFLDPPPSENIDAAIENLQFFGAIDSIGRITQIGKKMAGFPLEPELAKMLIVSEELGCSEEILIIVALLSVPNIFIRKGKRAKQSDAAKVKFLTNDGDPVMNLKVFKEWILSGRSKEWCRLNFIQGRTLNDASMIIKQLREIMIARNMRLLSSTYDMRPVRKSVCAGFVQNVAVRDLNSFDYSYTTIPKKDPPVRLYIHPGSSMYQRNPFYVVFQKVIQTSKPFMREVTPIESEWLKEFIPVHTQITRNTILL